MNIALFLSFCAFAIDAVLALVGAPGNVILALVLAGIALWVVAGAGVGHLVQHG